MLVLCHPANCGMNLTSIQNKCRVSMLIPIPILFLYKSSLCSGEQCAMISVGYILNLEYTNKVLINLIPIAVVVSILWYSICPPVGWGRLSSLTPNTKQQVFHVIWLLCKTKPPQIGINCNPLYPTQPSLLTFLNVASLQKSLLLVFPH